MMSMNRHSRLTLPLIAVAVIALALPSLGQVTFRGRYLTGGGGSIDPILTVNFEILSYSTPEEIIALVKAFNEGGESGFHTTFRAMKKGSLRVTSGRGMNIDFHSAREIPSDKGTKIELIAENTSFSLGASSSRTPSGMMFLVAILEIDANGKGEGKVYEDSTCRVLSTGEFVLDEFKRAPKIVTGLTQLKPKVKK
jgi:hypothetical protein